MCSTWACACTNYVYTNTIIIFVFRGVPFAELGTNQLQDPATWCSPTSTGNQVPWQATIAGALVLPGGITRAPDFRICAALLLEVSSSQMFFCCEASPLRRWERNKTRNTILNVMRNLYRKCDASILSTYIHIIYIYVYIIYNIIFIYIYIYIYIYYTSMCIWHGEWCAHACQGAE